MKKNSHAFVRFLNLFRALNKDCIEGSGYSQIHHEAVAILVFVSAENHCAVYPTITKVVQAIEFGTPPTIQRRLKELLTLGFVEFCEGEDKRHRLLRVTVKGDAYLNECSKLLERSLEPCVKDCKC